MSDDESDAEYERRYPNAREGMPLRAILLIVFGAVGFFGVAGLFVVGFVFGATAAVAPAGPPPVAMATVEPPQVRESFARAEFERLVTGKTVAEVKAILGEPPMNGGWEGEETWTYRERTTNPATGQPDGMTEVVFRGGKVVRVDYRDAAGPGGPGPAPK